VVGRELSCPSLEIRGQLPPNRKPHPLTADHFRREWSSPQSHFVHIVRAAVEPGPSASALMLSVELLRL
jgi:hypothetical protein